MTPNREKRKKEARILFVKKGWGIDEIAAHLRVQPSTVNRWRREDKNQKIDWNTQKAAVSLGGRDEQLAEVLNDYLNIHRQIMAELRERQDIDTIAKARVLASLADTFNRTTKAAVKVSPSLDHVALSHELLSKLSQYILSHHKNHAQDFAEILELFGIWLAEEDTA
jgi:transposase-like protein